ncbi:MAG: hypothetical protein WDZ31_02285 [Phycisphaeraceae bacterium]
MLIVFGVFALMASIGLYEMLWRFGRSVGPYGGGSLQRVEFAVAVVLLAFGVLGAVVFPPMMMQRKRRRSFRHCPSCGYDLRTVLMTDADNCPECGASVWDS